MPEVDNLTNGELSKTLDFLETKLMFQCPFKAALKAFSESTKMEMSLDSSLTTYEMEIRPVSLLSFAWAQTPHMVKIITVALI
jgi:hypothetical protein